MSDKQRNRGWVFTLNNYSEAEFEAIQLFECRYLCVGKETCPSSGTLHLQGYVEFDEAKSFSKVQKMLFKKAHIEPRMGTPKAASDYCKKEKNFFEKGDLPKQGKRSDLEAVVEAIKSGMNMKEIRDTFCIQWIKYEKGIRSLYEGLQEDRYERPTCVWLFGKGGVGKSFYPKNIHGVDNVFIKDEAKWWGKYDHEEAILIDDFDPAEWSYRRFLRLLDEGKYEGETKGGHITINSKFIYVSCEYPPEHYWQDNKLDQVTTRFTEIIEIKGECKRKAPVRRTIVV